VSTLNVNGVLRAIESEPDTPLLWVLRDELGLCGTKYGCGIAQCGACTVHIDGKPTRACVTPVASVEGQAIDTIEGLSSRNNGQLTAVQQAWLEQDVAQCGYCQSGQIMAATALLTKTTDPSDTEINQAMAGHICRCGTYPRIRAAIKAAGAKMRAEVTT